MGKSHAWIYDRLSLNKLDDNIGVGVDSGIICLSNAYKLATLNKEDQNQFCWDAMDDGPVEFHKKIKEFRKTKKSCYTMTI